jgi:hypothetical protein
MSRARDQKVASFSSQHEGRSSHTIILGTLKKASAAAFQGTGSDPF